MIYWVSGQPIDEDRVELRRSPSEDAWHLAPVKRAPGGAIRPALCGALEGAITVECRVPMAADDEMLDALCGDCLRLWGDRTPTQIP